MTPFIPLKSGKWKTASNEVRKYEWRGVSYEIEVSKDYVFNGASVPGIWPLLIGFTTLSVVMGAGWPECLFWGILGALLVRAWIPPIDGDYIGATAFHDRTTGEGEFEDGTKPKPIDVSRLAKDWWFLQDMRRDRYPFPSLPPFKRSKINKWPRWLFVSVPNWLLHFLRPWVMFAGVAMWGQIQRPFRFAINKIRTK